MKRDYSQTKAKAQTAKSLLWLTVFMVAFVLVAWTIKANVG